MALSIGSNIASLQVQRQLSRTTDAVSRSFERLSSGLRINRASDDAAGLAISTSLNADARIFGQGIRNLNDAISMFSIADSAYGELNNILGRIKELATQSANGTYGTTQRQALDNEAQALRLEYNRIVQTTKFNGVGLLDGSRTSVNIQAGGNSSVLSHFRSPVEI